MKTFIKNTISFILAIVISIFLIIFLLLSYFKVFTVYKNIIPKNNSILVINLKGKLYENAPPKTLFTKDKNQSLIKILECIKFAKKDPKIKGIKLKIGDFGSGWSSLEEIRKHLADFKKSKKLVIASAEVYNNKAFYIATIADKVILHPEGMFIWTGMSLKYFYYKVMLDRLKIKPLEFHVGEYKSYGEKFYKRHMSKYSRKQIKEILYPLYERLLNETSTSRNIKQNILKKFAKNLSIKTPKDALKFNLVDNLFYNDQIESFLKKKLKIKKNDEINYTNTESYFLYKRSKEKKYKNEIAVLIAEGQIINGKSRYGEVIGSKDFVKTIEKIRKNKKIKACVLRINSPGGDVLASGDINRAVKLLNKEKPVIVSMSDVAASGGYYIAIASNYILANKNTITGSIGVLSIMFNLGGLFNDYLGITNSHISTEPHSDIFSSYDMGLQRGLKSKEKNYIQSIMDNFYLEFITKVAKSRNLKLDYVNSIARGRVWLGSKANELKLVDRIGTLDDAIKIAAKRVKLVNNYSISYYPRKKLFYEVIFESSYDNLIDNLMKRILGDKYKHLKEIDKLSNSKGIQAILPYEVQVQ